MKVFQPLSAITGRWIEAHLLGLGSGSELGLSASLGCPALFEEGLWDGDLLSVSGRPSICSSLRDGEWSGRRFSSCPFIPDEILPTTPLHLARHRKTSSPRRKRPWTKSAMR